MSASRSIKFIILSSIVGAVGFGVAGLARGAATLYDITNGTVRVLSRPAEPLIGIFSLDEPTTNHSSHGDITAYDIISFDLQSASAAFTLSTGTLAELPNAEGTPTVALIAYMHAVGLPSETVLLRSSGTGRDNAFQNISIWNTNETEQLGSMSFSAVEVPRPALT